MRHDEGDIVGDGLQWVVVERAVNLVRAVHVMRTSERVVVEHVAVVVVQVTFRTRVVRRRHSGVRIMHHIERVVLLMRARAMRVMNGVQVIMACVVARVMAVQLVLVHKLVVVIISSVAKGGKVGIKRANFMETTRWLIEY